MYDDNRYDPMQQEAAQYDEQRAALYLARVMGWMCVGLLTTLVTAIVSLALPQVRYYLFSGNMVYGVIIAQFAVVIALSAAMRKLSPAAATVLFMLYAALTGMTFSLLVLLFELASLIYVFGITSLIFAGMAVYGFVTKRDLTRWGSLLLFGLLGIIVAGVVNLLLRSAMIDFVVTIVGIIVFIGLIAFDTQRIKDVYMSAVGAGHDEYGSELSKFAIYGAFTLYLDFINLFLKLLRLMGRRRN